MNDKIPKEYNYSPLHINVTRKQAVADYINAVKHNSTELIGFLFICFVTLGWFTLIASLLSVGISQPSAAIFITGTVMLVGTIGFLYLLLNVAKDALMATKRIHAFAKKNNIKLLTNASDPAYNGIIFGLGDTRKIEEAYVFEDGTPLEVGNYSYYIGAGKSRSQLRYGYIKVALPRHLPHILLDSTANSFHSSTSSLPIMLDPSQKLQLEGDFNKHFTLYAPKKYEKDVLYILTPDVMQSLIDSSHKYDIEIIDKSLYIYTTIPFKLYDEQELKNIRNITAIITKQIHHQTDYYADATIANREADIVSPQGQRLKAVPETTAILLAVLFAIYFVMLAISQTMLQIIAIILIVSAAVVFIYTKYIKNS